MTTPLVTATEDMPLDKVMKLMASRRIKKIPVILDRTLVGIVTSTDLLGRNPERIRLRRARGG